MTHNISTIGGVFSLTPPVLLKNIFFLEIDKSLSLLDTTAQHVFIDYFLFFPNNSLTLVCAASKGTMGEVTSFLFQISLSVNTTDSGCQKEKSMGN